MSGPYVVACVGDEAFRTEHFLNDIDHCSSHRD